MRLGIIGLPTAGKTTLFDVLTGASLPVGGMESPGRVAVHTGVVAVPDHRLGALSTLVQPRKTTSAQITFGDIGGMAEDGGIPGPMANALAHWDGLVLVLRTFEHPMLQQPADSNRDLSMVEAELLLNDLIRVEARLERLPEDRQKGARDRAELDREAKLFERLQDSLKSERALRELGLSEQEFQTLKAYNLLTLKPLLLVQNLAEGESPVPLDTELAWVAIHGKLELELGQLADDEARDFRTGFGIDEPGAAKVLRACLELLGRIIFFTVSDPEVKAWALPKGGTAVEAAGTVHSDMARGFIRAEVIAWDELVALGGLPQARAEGKLRVEGKDYPVADGEVIYIRFQV